MIIDSGKYKGISVGMVILKNPDYVAQVLDENDAQGQLSRIQIEMKRLISIFDSKPFNKNCRGSHCSRPAAKFTVYEDNIYNLYWWCDIHNPYESGASPATLTEIRTYEEALVHVKWALKGRKADYAYLIKAMAQAKGLPKRVGEDQVNIFLGFIM